jgi:hypothetical protein
MRFQTEIGGDLHASQKKRPPCNPSVGIYSDANS